MSLGIALSLLVAHNGAFETYGADARSRAMANASVALFSYAAAHTNPAAIAAGPDALLFEFSYSLDVPALQLTLAEARDANDPLTPAIPEPVSGLNFSVQIPIDLAFERTLFVGATGYFPTEVLIRARAYDPARPFFYTYDSTTEHYCISVGAGLRLLEWLHLGAGGRLSAGQAGTITLAVDPVRGRLTEQSADTFQFPTFSPTAGLLIGPLGIDEIKGSFGVVWREPSDFTVDLPATLSIEGADIDAILGVLVLSNYSPRTLTSGVGFDILGGVTVDVEAQYAFWSDAPPPLVITSVDLSGEGLAALGFEEGLDAPAAGQDRVVDPEFVDTLNLRMGVEWRTLKDVLAVRAGYQYRPTPIPDQVSGTNYADATTHVVSTGFGLTFQWPAVFKQPVVVEAAYQAHILQPRTAKKTNPNDEVGDWTAQGTVHALALGWRYVF